MVQRRFGLVASNRQGGVCWYRFADVNLLRQRYKHQINIVLFFSHQAPPPMATGANSFVRVVLSHAAPRPIAVPFLQIGKD